MTRNRQKEDVAFLQLDPLEHGVMEGEWWWLCQRHWGAPMWVMAMVCTSWEHRSGTLQPPEDFSNKTDWLAVWMVQGCRSASARQNCSRCGWWFGKIHLQTARLRMGIWHCFSSSYSLLHLYTMWKIKRWKRGSWMDVFCMRRSGEVFCHHLTRLGSSGSVKQKRWE